MQTKKIRFLPLQLLLLITLAACQSTGQASTSSEAGIETGIYEDLEATAFAAKMEVNTDYVLLDVRTPSETAQGKIDGAVELDYRSATFAEDLAKLDKDKTYLVYCASGGRSSKTCRLMQEQGFQECYNLLGGYSGWPY